MSDPTIYDLVAKAQDAFHYLLAASGCESSFSGDCWTLRGVIKTFDAGVVAVHEACALASTLGLVHKRENSFDFLSADPSTEPELRLIAARGVKAFNEWCDALDIHAREGRLLVWERG